MDNKIGEKYKTKTKIRRVDKEGKHFQEAFRYCLQMNTNLGNLGKDICSEQEIKVIMKNQNEYGDL